MERKTSRLVVVSNRLPLILKPEARGFKKTHPGAGGLVTALNPIMKQNGGAWIGWPGLADGHGTARNLEPIGKDAGYTLHPVALTEEEKKGYYDGFANAIIWPLFHSFETRCNFKSEYWDIYKRVNLKFAEEVAAVTTEDDYVWVQDYHLMGVGHYLKRQLHEKRKLGFFLHIPFPPADVFCKLPWRAEVLQGLLEYDLLGVQTMNDFRNLLEAFRRVQNKGVKITGKGALRDLVFDDRTVRVGVFPISIDYKHFVSLSSSPEMSLRSESFQAEFPGQKILLGVDRLDYTKGIPERIEAYWAALKKHPEMRGKICFVQVVVPSRSGVEEYEKIKQHVEQLVSQVNGELGVPGWTPIHYFYRALPRSQLVAYLRAADIAIVTPLRDGMNLISKEYCACNLKKNGVLILSEFAGSAAELKVGALLVNPYDLKAMSEAIYKAYRMPLHERQKRMEKLQAILSHNDIYHWLSSFMEGVYAEQPDLATHVEELVPRIAPLHFEPI